MLAAANPVTPRGNEGVLWFCDPSGRTLGKLSALPDHCDVSSRRLPDQPIKGWVQRQ
jgi:hypothetical protein